VLIFHTMIQYIPLNHPGEQEQALRAIRESIDGEGFCVVRNGAWSADEFMAFLHERFAASFTFSRQDGRRVPYDLVQDRGQENYNPASSILSTSNLVFPLHTDCSYLEKPADVVTLYCIENAEHGGESLLVNVNEIVPHLPPGYAEFLLTEKFTVYSKAYPVLEKEGGRYTVRFSPDEILASYPEGEKEAVKEKLKPLTYLLDNPAHYKMVKLSPDECLIVNNRSSLHGRTAFEANSRRVFLRARQYVNREL
jgi:alpha-ketoglutarate-dependent taurine dioxygenase